MSINWIANAAKWVFDRTLNNVWFGITLMVLTAGYVAIGSGMPEVREAFEMDEMKFFTAWPLKVLMALLVMSLVTVTVIRIPFTPPRYGVWMIHAGIITLIWGMSHYYRYKVEGLAFIPKGRTAMWYYDRFERALWVRLGDGAPLMGHTLKDLPRFREHEPVALAGGKLGPSGYFESRPWMAGVVPYIEFMGGSTGASQILGKELGLAHDLTIDVLGYYPYAEIDVSWQPAGAGEVGTTALYLTTRDNHGDHTGHNHAPGEHVSSSEWLSHIGPNRGRTTLGDSEIEHRVVTAEELEAITAAATRMHKLRVTLPGFSQELFVEPGKSYKLGDSGYEISVTDFNPAWPTMDKQVVKLLTLMVKGGPVGEFRRQVMPNRPPTDWKLGDPDAGPMGKRQTAPLDANLVIEYQHDDTFRLMPLEGTEKRLIMTTTGTDAAPARTVLVSLGFTHAAEVTEFAGGKGVLNAGREDQRVDIHVERHEQMRRTEAARAVPKESRERRTGESGIMQVLVVRVNMGDWNEIVYVPFTTWARDLFGAWRGGQVLLPGLDVPLQLQLGQAWEPMPAPVRLDKFELVKYPGATENTMMHRDFMSTVAIREPDTGAEIIDTAHMNNPIYFGRPPYVPAGVGRVTGSVLGGYWTLFQAQWDPNGQRYTVLGVGNRPGIGIMTLGCVLMVVGLMYAFYLKPVIIARMKKAALAKAGIKKPATAAKPEKETADGELAGAR
jgi:hypothetical protein